MALFITFEGGEGSGKTVQARALYRKLRSQGVPSLLTQEPGGTVLGRRLACFLKWQDGPVAPLTELLLFNASRAHLVAEVIRPALEEGKLVICDRYTDSTTVYQGYGRGLDLKLVASVNGMATGGLKPDLVVLLDIPVEAGLARKKDQKRDRFEQENVSFHHRVQAGYLTLAAEEPERWLVVDASQSKDKVRRIIWQRVSQLLSTRGK